MTSGLNFLSKIRDVINHHPIKCTIVLGVSLYVIRALQEWRALNKEHYKNNTLPDLHSHVIQFLRNKQYKELEDLLNKSTPHIANYLFWTYITVPNYQGRCPMHLIANAIDLIPSQRGKGGIKQSEHKQLCSISVEIERIYRKVDKEIEQKSFFSSLMIYIVGRGWNGGYWWEYGYEPNWDDIEGGKKELGTNPEFY